MSDLDSQAVRRSVIGGRHGSPTITIALPFSQITSGDPDARDAVAELAALVARLATSSGDEVELGQVREAAETLAARLSKGE